MTDKKSETPDNSETSSAAADPAPAPAKPREPLNPVWMRGLMMLILAFFFSFAGSILGVIALVQFFWTLFNKEPNPALRTFGTGLADWMRQTARFQVFATEDKPFPWAEWPRAS